MSRLAIVLAFSVSVALEARADTIKFCASVPVAFSDNDFADMTGNKEDNWRTDGAKDMKGHFASILRGSSLIWSGYMDDGFGSSGAGCTPAIAVPDNNGAYSIVVTSKALVQGNYIQGLDLGSMRGFNVSVNFSFLPTNYVYSFTSSLPASGGYVEAFRLSMTGAFALYRHAGGLSGETLKLDHNISYTDDDQYDPWSNTVEIGMIDSKFLIAHEIGHFMSVKAAGLSTLADNYSLNGFGKCEGSGSHKMTSQEEEKAAFQEGFAHFYAADVWNSHNETEGVFRYWREIIRTCNGSSIDFRIPTIDIEGGADDRTNPQWTSGACPGITSDGLPNAFMETQCTGPFVDRGTELDWMRNFWDMHTGPNPAASMNEILVWMEDAFFFTNFDTWDELNDAADRAGGDLDDRWDQYQAYNGIQH